MVRVFNRIIDININKKIQLFNSVNWFALFYSFELLYFILLYFKLCFFIKSKLMKNEWKINWNNQQEITYMKIWKKWNMPFSKEKMELFVSSISKCIPRINCIFGHAIFFHFSLFPSLASPRISLVFLDFTIFLYFLV